MSFPLIPFIAIFFASLFGLLVYLIPAFVAFHREHESKIKILAINFFGGWTIAGWIYAMVLALRDE
nr:superinfection immunity protein [Neorhizobium tomejilense]